MDKFKNILVPLPNMSREYKPIIPYIHDRYLSPELLKLAVLNDPKIRELCIEIAQAKKQNVFHVNKLVKEILDEIGLAHSLPVIRTLGICLNKIFMGMTSGVYVNSSSIDLVKNRLSGGECPVIYLPSHRSYADFILISYICFVHDLEIPVGCISPRNQNLFLYCFVCISCRQSLLEWVNSWVAHSFAFCEPLVHST